MKILADENFPGPVVEALRKQGHDVVWARIDCPGSSDVSLLERGEAEERILVTLDRDFWQLALQRPGGLKRSGVVLFRVHPAIPANISPLVEAMLRAGQEWAGHVSIITAGGIEMFPVESDDRA
jgi:predicted nuclease of predicted toxin-antitoxin system